MCCRSKTWMLTCSPHSCLTKYAAAAPPMPPPTMATWGLWLPLAGVGAVSSSVSTHAASSATTAALAAISSMWDRTDQGASCGCEFAESASRYAFAEQTGCTAYSLAYACLMWHNKEMQRCIEWSTRAP